MTAIALLAVASGASPVSAQEPTRDSGTISWAISPAAAEGGDTRSAIQKVVEPGQTFVEHVLVENLSEVPISVDLYAADAVVADGGFDLAPREDASAMVGAWVVPEVDRLDLPARAEAVVPVTVTIPDDAEPGDHAGGIVASRLDGAGTQDLVLDTERRVGTRVFLRVAGPIDPGVEVVGLDASHRGGPGTVAPGSVVASVEAVNSGNVRLSGYVEVTVSGPFGLLERSVRGVPVDDLLPGQALSEELVVDGVWPTGRLDVEARFVPSGSVGQPLDGLDVDDPSADATVWAVPWVLVVVVIVGAALLVVRRVRATRRGSERGGARETLGTGGSTASTSSS